MVCLSQQVHVILKARHQARNRALVISHTRRPRGNSRALPLLAAGEDTMFHNVVPNEEYTQVTRLDSGSKVLLGTSSSEEQLPLCRWFSFQSHGFGSWVTISAGAHYAIAQQPV